MLKRADAQMLDIIDLIATLLLAVNLSTWWLTLSCQHESWSFFPAEHSDGTRLEGDKLDRSARPHEGGRANIQ